MPQNDKSLLRIIAPAELEYTRYNPIDDDTLNAVNKIIKDISKRGETAVREYAVRFGDMEPNAPLLIGREDFDKYTSKVDSKIIALLKKTASRIRYFAEQQLATARELTIAIEGGIAGHNFIPVDTVGCYCPNGRFPLLSTVLMTAIPARTAGVRTVIVTTPRPSPEMLVAAEIAAADYVLTIGGAQAIAAMAYGTGDIPACDMIVGPGNRWVSAAKKLLYGQVAIDMIAGPSELVVFADKSANPELIALDLLAQAEHDVDALPILISLDNDLITDVRRNLRYLLDESPTATAERSLTNGFAINASTISEGIELCNKIAPEHLELCLKNNNEVIGKVKNYGALFIGGQSAEVFGDYGVGPNHVLPTSGTAGFASGLSVMAFLRQATWLELNDLKNNSSIVRDTMEFARLEGLYWHSRAAQARLTS